MPGVNRFPPRPGAEDDHPAATVGGRERRIGFAEVGEDRDRLDRVVVREEHRAELVGDEVRGHPTVVGETAQFPAQTALEGTQPERAAPGRLVVGA